jgi:hypothetical protein
MSRAARWATLFGVLTAACASDGARPLSSIGLSLSLPKGLIDVDRVTLYVYDQTEVPCKDAGIPVPPTTVDRIFEIKLAKSGTAWSGGGEIERNPDRVLTFYVEGKFEAKQGGFSGCVERAVDQNPLQIDMKAQPIVEGGQCGDAAAGYGETCDPAGRVSDEACDAMRCQTKEVILSNGTVSNSFFRGRPGRKTSIGVRWIGDRLYGVWSDQATNAGNDGSNEVTVRLMKQDVLTETAPVVLASEVRLPAGAMSGPTTFGGAKRGGSDISPAMAPLSSGSLLFAFINDGSLRTVSTDFKFIPSAADVTIGPATSVHVASSSSGHALIAFADGTAVKTALRSPDGMLGATQSIGTIAAGGRPRVAWLGADFVVVWSDGNDIKARKLSASDGTPKPEIVVNAAKTAGAQTEPDVAGFESGEFIVAWKDGAGDVGADIRVQKFNNTGAPTGNEIAAVINDKFKDGDQDQPAVAAGRTPAGLRFYLVAWRTTNNIAARFVRVDEAGFMISHLGSSPSEFKVGEGDAPRSSPAIAIGTATAPYCAIAWADDRDADVAGDDDRVRIRRLPLPDPPK